MPETEKPHTTSAFSRRAAILGGAALASAAAVPAAAASHTPSPEFIGWQRAWRTFCETCDSEPGYDDDHVNAISAAHQDAIRALIAKPVRTWHDVVELAIADREASFEDGEICWSAYRGESSCGIEHAVLKAVLTMGGVSNV